MEERNEGDIYIELDEPVSDDAQVETTDDSDKGQNQSDNQVPPVNSKWEGKSREDILSSYEALEKKFGEQGRELGDLRKGNAPDKGQSKTFSDVSSRIAELEKKIYTDDFDRYDAEDRKLQQEYDKLNREYASLNAEQKYQSDIANRENVKVIAQFKEKFSELSVEEIDDVANFAINQLSTHGVISEADLEASLLRNDPARYRKFTELKARGNERERISNAHSQQQPRLSASGQTNKVVNLSQLLRENPGKGKEVLKGLTDEQLNKLI